MEHTYDVDHIAGFSIKNEIRKTRHECEAKIAKRGREELGLLGDLVQPVVNVRPKTIAQVGRDVVVPISGLLQISDHQWVKSQSIRHPSRSLASRVPRA